MKNGIQYQVIEEGNLSLVKDTDDFGGPNQWRLHIRSKHGYWKEVKWGHVSHFECLFNTKLPWYKEESSKKVKYKLAD